MERSIRLLSVVTALVVGLALMGAVEAKACRLPSSNLLLPNFDVGLTASDPDTIFSVSNASDSPADVAVLVFSNWGIHVLEVPMTIAANSVLTIDLADWIVDGIRPPGSLQYAGVTAGELQDALLGMPVFDSGSGKYLYYATPNEPDLATGYVSVEATGAPPHHLWGDYFVISPSRDQLKGNAILDATGGGCPADCTTHGFRFMEGGLFSSGTRMAMRIEQYGVPSEDPLFPFGDLVRTDLKAYNDGGTLIDEFTLWLLPQDVIHIGELGLTSSFGWLQVTTQVPSKVVVDYSDADRYSSTFEAACLPDPDEIYGIDIEKSTNGEDADNPPGPSVPVGDAVTWEYVVTNTGLVELSSVVVTDDQLGVLTCPKDTLAPYETMTCTATSSAVPCLYSNTATVTAETPLGMDVTDQDSSHYTGVPNASVEIEKTTNGHDADSPPGPSILAGGPVLWAYTVTNTGDIDLSNVYVTDSVLGPIGCPQSTLAVGASMTCTASGAAVAGQNENVGSVNALTPCGNPVSDHDLSHYFGESPGIDIEKSTNGEDADSAPGPTVYVGDTVTWEYVVTNTGNVPLGSIAVTDDHLGAVSCPSDTLGAGASMTCTAGGAAVEGQYGNTGSVTGQSPLGMTVNDSDPSHYLGEQYIDAEISIEKHTFSQDADYPPGPIVRVGSLVYWSYTVTNTGEVTLTDIAVTDSKGVDVNCPLDALDPGESMVCTASGAATDGQYVNIGTASGLSPDYRTVDDTDASHYYGAEGCSEGFWYTNTGVWPAPYQPSQSLVSVFSAASAYPALNSITLREALALRAGPWIDVALRTMIVRATAALLNAADPTVSYPKSTAEIINAVNNALISGNKNAMLALAMQLNHLNGMTCPL